MGECIRRKMIPNINQSCGKEACNKKLAKKSIHWVLLGYAYFLRKSFMKYQIDRNTPKSVNTNVNKGNGVEKIWSK
jgi:hypothetical protein